MKIDLVGYTGFVGSNLVKEHRFDGLYNSKNIDLAFGRKPDLLIYSGVRAEKFLANREPDKDLNIINNAFNNIKKINPKKIVLISTIDVYKNPYEVDEESKIEDSGNLPYGSNRRELEKLVEREFDDYLIIRLPGLYGNNIKKNFIYDLINIIPNLLNEAKYNEIIRRNDDIKNFYFKQENGFYKCKELNNNEKSELKQYFNELGFSALNFTDSRGQFQFYNLAYLYEHINIALNNGIKKLNLATEPILISEFYKYVTGNDFDNKIVNDPPIYDFKTKYYEIFGGEKGYIFNKEFILEDIKKFIINHQ